LPGQARVTAPRGAAYAGSLAGQIAVEPIMRTSLAVPLLSFAYTGYRGSHIAVVPMPGPQRNCPYAPAGSNAHISLIVLSDRGDTLRASRILLQPNQAQGGSRDSLVATTPSPSGRVELGPLEVGEYRLTVSAAGRQVARSRVGFCQNDTLHLRAVLVPVSTSQPLILMGPGKPLSICQLTSAWTCHGAAVGSYMFEATRPAGDGSQARRTPQVMRGR